MNVFLKSAFDEYNNLKGDKRRNYNACYDSFSEYCDIYSEYNLKHLFNNVISLHDIEQACKKYFLSSKKTKSLEAINRFLSAIDLFYLEYLVPCGIKCEALESGCRNKQVVKRICDGLNQDIGQKIYLPLSEEEITKVKQLVDDLDENKFYTYGQKIIFELFINYGFKAQVIFDMPMDALDLKKGTLMVGNENSVELELNEKFIGFFNKYCDLQKYPDRMYLFTNTKGKKLTSASVLDSLKQKTLKAQMEGITSTTIALNGIENLINKGFTISEIRRLTGFEAQKVIDVSEYMLVGKNIDDIINGKL